LYESCLSQPARKAHFTEAELLSKGRVGPLERVLIQFSFYQTKLSVSCLPTKICSNVCSLSERFSCYPAKFWQRIKMLGMRPVGTSKHEAHRDESYDANAAIEKHSLWPCFEHLAETACLDSK
jgi:hypothetical protein